ncbi:MAG TPA: hypothetical protein VGX91_11985 [Candidatus Cybelea sp.]|jgi:hypothetical protein|nr:hypothetical protein [Candidatus Cybelea sp.]
MTAVRQKLAFARHAIDEMRTAQLRASRDDFDYHFGAYLALLGALRQFILVKPHKQWVYSMDERDLSYCCCIDLRNVDVHTTNVGPARAAYQLQLVDAIVGFTASLTAKVMHKGKPPGPERDLSAPKASTELQNRGRQTSPTVTFFVNVAALPPDFAVLYHSGKARDTKRDEESHLRAVSAIDVALGAIDFFEVTVLPQAQRLGIPIP